MKEITIVCPHCEKSVPVNTYYNKINDECAYCGEKITGKYFKEGNSDLLDTEYRKQKEGV